MWSLSVLMASKSVLAVPFWPLDQPYSRRCFMEICKSQSLAGSSSRISSQQQCIPFVLCFIHTEDIDPNAVSIAIEVWHAASFFLLPKLIQLMLDQVTDFGVAASLLNDAADTEGPHESIFMPFCANSLAIGDLNGLSDKALELLLTYTTTTMDFKTSEYNLLLCVIEWAWVRDTVVLPTAERYAIFDDINSLPTELSIKIHLQSERSRTSLLKLLSYFDLSLICPHSLNCLAKSINVFDELPQVTRAFCHHACENAMCGPAHPSRFRGERSPSELQWKQSNLMSDLVFSEEGTVVEYPSTADYNFTTSIVRTTTKVSTECSADRDSISEWTITVESLGVDDNFSVGLVEESLHHSRFLWQYYSNMIIYKGNITNDNYGVHIKKGDTITFHLFNRNCTLSVNGHNYGVAWYDLPQNVNLYPAVGLRPGNKCRIKSSHTDSLHDVVLICADGVEIGACRAILASRLAVFKEMFYRNMQESISGRVFLPDIKSAAMHAVLYFIYTEDIDSNAVSAAVEVYRAASFFILPKLMQLVLNQTYNITDFSVAASLLNDAADTERFHDSVFNPFCVNALAVGDLNGLSDKALELLLTYTKTNTTVDFKTSEYNLLLCVIEWVWVHDTTMVPAAKRREIFDNINNLTTELSIKIHLQSERLHTSLLKLLNHFDLSLVCPHRLNRLIKSINVFDELPRITWAFCYHACEYTTCSPAHPSQFRGEPSPSKLQWKQSNFACGLIFSEEDTVVEYPTHVINDYMVARTSTKRLADRDGTSKWTIVVESLSSHGVSEVGLVGEYWKNQSGVEWGLSSGRIYCRSECINDNYGYSIKNGDAVTFHQDLKNRTCTLSINGHNYGVAWRDLPRNVNLYPAVGLRPGNKYRIKS